MYKINYVDLIDVAKCYDKLSSQEISWSVAIWRLEHNLKNTFWVVIDSRRLIS